MKRTIALLALCSLGIALQAASDKPKTKYICSLGGITTTDFATKEECNEACFRPGVAAVCEETAAATDVEDTEDTEDIY